MTDEMDNSGHEDEMKDRTFTEALRDTISLIIGTEAFVSLWHPNMGDFEDDPWPAIQLAIAILLDKPIIVLAPAGREPPEKLRRIADRVIHGDLDAAMVVAIRAAVDELVPQ